MKIGGLYQLKKYYWLLYPSSDAVAAAVEVAATTTAAATTAAVELTQARAAAACWSKRLNSNICCLVPSSIFMLLEQTERFCKILSTEGNIGWIIYPENEGWTKGCFEEVKAE